MFAGSQLDMCVGLDIHMEMVPMPAPVPTPFPMPFVGQVEFSATGVLMGMGIGKAMSFITGAPPTGPVLVNGFHAVKTGDEAKNAETLPHIVIPPGTMWTPLPKPLKLKISPPPPAPDNPAAPPGDAIFITGSKTVNFEQSSACRLGTLAMSCSDPVRLPSSVLMSVPKGLPVLVGGPPAIDWMAAAKAFFLRNKWTAGLLHQLVSLLPPGRFQNLLGKAVCFLTGHPVDVATGRLLTWTEDFVLRGPIRFPFERNYSSGWAERNSTLGFGWSHTYDERIWVERGRVVYLAGDGRELEFHTHELPGRVMREGQELSYPIDRLTLRNLGNGRWSVRSADGLVREFAIAADGDRRTSQIERVVDRHGHWIRFVYQRGFLDRVETSEGRGVRFEHKEGRLVRISVPAGQVDGWYDQVRFRYSAEGDLAAAVDSLNAARTYAYEEHLLVQETDRDGVKFWFEYDGRDSTSRCVRTWGSDGKTTDRLMYRDITYDIAGRRTFVEDSLGNTSVFEMNAANAVVAVIDPHGGRTAHEYDERLQLTASTNPLGARTSIEYDSAGREIRRCLTDGTETRITYDESGQLRTFVDALGCEWSWDYDAAGRLIRRGNDTGEGATFEYDGRVPRRMVRSDGVAVSFSYDAAENLIELTVAGKASLHLEYDRQGRIVKSQDFVGHVTRVSYDLEGRQARIDEGGSTVRSFEYSGEGCLVAYRDPLRAVTFGYCGFQRLSWRGEAGHQVNYQYDSEGDLASVLDELKAEYTLTRDACGRVVAEVGFDGREHRFVRDLAGRVVTVRKPSQKRRFHEYDRRDRLTRVVFDDETEETFSYDAAGNLVSASNANGSIGWHRDKRGRVVREQYGDDWVVSGYDRAGRRTSKRTSWNINERIQLDALGAATAIDVMEATGALERPVWSVQMTRNASGRELRRSLAGGVDATWTYDDVGLPVVRELSRGGEQLEATKYRWTGNERLVCRDDAGVGATTYHHDARGRLSRAVHPDGIVQEKAFGPTGDVYRRSDCTDRRYAPGGVLLEMDGSRFEYDADGNQTRRVDADGAVAAFTWNAAGMLVGVVGPDGVEVSYSYDALGRRVRRRVQNATGSESTHWRWDGDFLTNEYVDGNAANGTCWIFEPGKFSPVSQIVTRAEQGSPVTRAYSIVTDYLGTPEAMFDAAGRLAWQSQLDLYGVSRMRRGDANDCLWRWPGQLADPYTGLHQNRFRDYDPSLGRYISPDRLRLLGGTSFYAYVADPLVGIDPLGLIGTVVPVPTLSQALSQGAAFANVPRVSKGGEVIPLSELNPSSRGPNWAAMKAAEDASPNQLGAGLGRSGPGGQSFFLHPDGHPLDPGGHHDFPHVHAQNEEGEEKIFVVNPKACGK